MLRRHLKRGKKAQVILEYALVVGAMILIMLAMSTMIKRGSQSMIKTVADQIGNQEGAEQKYDDSGHLENSYSSLRVNTLKILDEDTGNITYTFFDSIVTEGDASINLGYTEDN